MDDDKEAEQGQFEGLIQGLLNQEYGCCDHFVDEETVSGLRNNMQRFKEQDNMKTAGLGRQSGYQQNQEVRGDEIKWLEQKSTDQFEEVFLRKIEQFVLYLNKTCYTSINGYESHYANYGRHQYYKRHLDQFKQDSSRQYSIVLYLNENWLESDGGLLSLYLKEGKQQDISPIGGRMVFFKSDEMEHEVHPSFTRGRMSIAGWLKHD